MTRDENNLERLNYLYEKSHSIGGLTKEERMKGGVLK